MMMMSAIYICTIPKQLLHASEEDAMSRNQHRRRRHHHHLHQNKQNMCLPQRSLIIKDRRIKMSLHATSSIFLCALKCRLLKSSFMYWFLVLLQRPIVKLEYYQFVFELVSSSTMKAVVILFPSFCSSIDILFWIVFLIIQYNTAR